jgi:hypothetical protein
VRKATQTRMDMLQALAPLLEGAHHQPNNPSGSGLVSGNASCGKLCSQRMRVMSGSTSVLGGALCALCSNDPSGSHDALLSVSSRIIPRPPEAEENARIPRTLRSPLCGSTVAGCTPRERAVRWRTTEPVSYVPSPLCWRVGSKLRWRHSRKPTRNVPIYVLNCANSIHATSRAS